MFDWGDAAFICFLIIDLYVECNVFTYNCTLIFIKTTQCQFSCSVVADTATKIGLNDDLKH